MADDKPRKAVERHGHAARGQHSATYRSWRSMMTRCYHKSQTAYPYYGGRGITVCARWRKSFLSFLADVGERPSEKHSIDRINRKRNYTPGNVRWATDTQQMRNSDKAHPITFRRRTCCIAEWAERTSISKFTIATRLASGWTIQKALTTKPRWNSHDR